MLELRSPYLPLLFSFRHFASKHKKTSTNTSTMPRAKKFKGPLVSPLAIKFDAMDTHQSSSDFLNLVPEIRNLIYDMVFTPKRLPSVKYQTPLVIKRKISLSLLATCRKIYLETHLHPLETNMHIDTLFPCKSSSRHLVEAYSRYPFDRMAAWQRSTIDEVHLIGMLCHACIMQGPYLKVLLSRTGMAQQLCKLHLHWVPEEFRRSSCPRASYWSGHQTRNEAWDLKNFTLLKEITIEFQLGPNLEYFIGLTNIMKLAKTWSFQVGGGRVLHLDLNSPTRTSLFHVVRPSTAALRWI